MQKQFFFEESGGMLRSKLVRCTPSNARAVCQYTVTAAKLSCPVVAPVWHTASISTTVQLPHLRSCVSTTTGQWWHTSSSGAAHAEGVAHRAHAGRQHVSTRGLGRCNFLHSQHPCAVRGLSSAPEARGRDGSVSDTEWNPLKMRWASLPENEADNETACTLRLANMINAFRSLTITPPTTVPLCACRGHLKEMREHV